MSKRIFYVNKTTQLNLDFLIKHDLDMYETLDQLEVSLILDAIKKCNGNYSAAARLLKINRTTFMMKLNKVRYFDVPFPQEKEEKVIVTQPVTE